MLIHVFAYEYLFVSLLHVCMHIFQEVMLNMAFNQEERYYGMLETDGISRWLRCEISPQGDG